MKLQIEVTTRCNFDCWYCAGRHMEQKDMELDVFEKILASIPRGSEVSLQGEGEPLLWPHFEDVINKYGSDYKFSTITNGTIHKNLSKLSSLGISIDTMDKEVAKANGRHNLDKVISNLIFYRDELPFPITVFAVDFGQDLVPLIKWCEFQCLTLVIQPKQEKADYIKFYPKGLQNPVPKYNSSVKSFTCEAGFVGKPMYWNVDGVALPCCFTKDLESFHDCHNTHFRLSAGIEPKTCSGCRYLRPNQ